MQKLDNVVREMEKIGTDAASYLVIVKDLKSVHFTMDKKLEEYQLSQSVSLCRSYGGRQMKLVIFLMVSFFFLQRQDG